jgi:TonB family protein
LSFFDVDGRYDEVDGVGSAISRREAILLSLIAHLLFVIAMLVMPDVPWFAALTARDVPPPVQQARAEQQLPFMRVETSAAPQLQDRPRVASDADRRAASPERAPEPSNDMPFSRGDTSDMVDGTPAPEPRGEPAPAPPSVSRPTPPAPSASGTNGALPRPAPPAAAPSGLGESLRNLDQIIRRERFDNPQGGIAQNEAAISFDSKGIDFGPWLTRFVAQVKRNWLIPYAAQTMRGRVVLTFYVHRNGRISDLKVLRPSDVGAFNTAAFQALVQSNPTLALPPDYPEDKVLFTVTFFYNERPQ